MGSRLGCGVSDRLAPAAAVDVRVHHVAHDGPGADDGHLHHQVVEALGLDARQGGHLGAALHLEHADGVRLAQHGVHRGVVGRQVRHVDLPARLPHDLDGVLDHRHHPQAQEIDLDDAQGGAVFLVPLDHHPARHGGRLQGDDVVEAAGGDDHAPRVLAEMARQVLDARPQGGEGADARVRGIAARRGEVAGQHVGRIAIAPDGHQLGQPLAQVLRQPEGFAHLARRAPASIGDDVGGHGRAEAAVLLDRRAG